jgi:integrase
MRRSEILSIRREHVNLQRNVIFIPRAKAGAREQPITRDLAEFLGNHIESLPPGSEWLFPSVGSAFGHLHDIRKAFRRSVTRAGMDPDKVVRHTLRHTAITHLVQAGVDLPTVQRISGHKTLAMVARYAHQNGAHVQTAMDKLERRLRTPDAPVSLRAS